MYLTRTGASLFASVKRYWNIVTCESFNPSCSANFFRSGLLIYFWVWKRSSKPFLWTSEKTALLNAALLALPGLNVCGHIDGGTNGTNGMVSANTVTFFDAKHSAKPRAKLWMFTWKHKRRKRLRKMCEHISRPVINEIISRLYHKRSCVWFWNLKKYNKDRETSNSEMNHLYFFRLEESR